MAENNSSGIEKGANGDATVPESQPSIPPAAKGPVDAGEDSTKPSITTETAKQPTTETTTDTAAIAPSSEPEAQKDVTGTATLSKEELTAKLDEAQTLASQPEKPVDSTTAQTTTDTAAAEAPSLTNGEAKEPPKPVTVEEIHDQDMPDAAPPQPTEMTGALPVDEPAKDAPKVDDEPKIDAVPAPSETGKSEVSTGDKRKLSEASIDDGDDAAEKPAEDAPVEKKKKTNGTTTNGPPKKVGRPRKDSKEKKAVPSTGRTARKTRSQGAAE
ncbi:uncharacterized protein GGS22DRAFT_69790 [Annulohypoxylon maeteangense]|uniref:uncharacterized protein n=1 Tax=Annulohypoxylon maeteangense TaxID=1927788 RepID=UPI0020088A5F|nr:uncharacterized protein GGS22DRAFT_69790 [Annulohypoxylon maeteangense]KAI0889317.1 hypothetical protein GGS22DRAFT_69790 [Annulohypoxylon maeteangense]